MIKLSLGVLAALAAATPAYAESTTHEQACAAFARVVRSTNSFPVAINMKQAVAVTLRNMGRQAGPLNTCSSAPTQEEINRAFGAVGVAPDPVLSVYRVTSEADNVAPGAPYVTIYDRAGNNGHVIGIPKLPVGSIRTGSLVCVKDFAGRVGDRGAPDAEVVFLPNIDSGYIPANDIEVYTGSESCGSIQGTVDVGRADVVVSKNQAVVDRGVPSLASTLSLAVLFKGNNFYWSWAGVFLLLALGIPLLLRKAATSERRKLLWQKHRHRYVFDDDTGEFHKRSSRQPSVMGYVLGDNSPRDRRIEKEMWFLEDHRVRLRILTFFATPIFLLMAKYRPFFGWDGFSGFLNVVMWSFFAIFGITVLFLYFSQIFLYATGRSIMVIDPPAEYSAVPFGPASLVNAPSEQTHMAGGQADLAYNPIE